MRKGTVSLALKFLLLTIPCCLLIADPFQNPQLTCDHFLYLPRKFSWMTLGKAIPSTLQI